LVEAPAPASSATLAGPASSFSLGGGTTGLTTALALLASAVGSSSVGCDINKLCADAGTTNWPNHLAAERSLWDALDGASRKAAAETRPREAFAFVDLTGRETLPVWLPHGVLSTGRQADQSMLGLSQPEQVKQRMAALVAATSSPRAFASLGQWHATWRRYAVVAVATKQLAWTGKAQHEEVVDHLYEDERAAGRNPLLVLLCDEVARWGMG
jgi:hypothetical protein